MRLLLVEDDAMIGESVRKGLRQDGYAVDWVRNGPAAESSLATNLYDLLLLDLGLPGKDGLDILATLRAKGDPIPVLVLTARDAVPDRVRGLSAGADDYLVKPFDLDELSARIQALLRRQAGRAQPLIRHDGITLDPAARSVTRDGQAVALSAREFALLETLLHRRGVVLSVAQLEDKLYGWNEEVSSNAVEVHIHSLRKKLGSGLIRNVRGLGYTIPRPEPEPELKPKPAPGPQPR